MKRSILIEIKVSTQ